jgi:hypothetical protein
MFENLIAELEDFMGEILRDHTLPLRQGRPSNYHQEIHSQPLPHSHVRNPRPHSSVPSQGHRKKDRPLTAQPSSSYDVKDFDLDLKSLWFAKSPPAFPPRSMNQDGKLIFSSSSGWSSSGVRKTHTFTAHVRNTATLVSSKIHLTWDASNPAVTVKAEQRHDPPPRQLSLGELESCRERYGEYSCILGSCLHQQIFWCCCGLERVEDGLSSRGW